MDWADVEISLKNSGVEETGNLLSLVKPAERINGEDLILMITILVAEDHQIGAKKGKRIILQMTMALGLMLLKVVLSQLILRQATVL